MQELTVGTKNSAKLKQIKGALANLDIRIIGLPEGFSLEVQEDGQTARENARKKATATAAALGKKALSMDNALYLNGLSPEEQPGINVRRIKGRSDRPDDRELQDYYSQLIKGLGGEIKGWWEFAVCLAEPDGTFQETTIISPRVFTDKISARMIVGYPLESMQIDDQSGKCLAEMSEKEQDEFWQKKIGKELGDFIRRALKL